VNADPLRRRELRVFDYYRVVEAVMLTALVFSPASDKLGLPTAPGIGGIMALGFLFGALALALLTRRRVGSLGNHVVLGLSLDLLAATTAMTALPTLSRAVATLLLVNVSAAALLLETRLAFLGAAVAASVTLISFGVTAEGVGAQEWLEAGLFGIGYFAATALCQALSRQVNEARELAERRQLDLANLDYLNELIIKRMRTGVLVVDAHNSIRRYNESAWALLGSQLLELRHLPDVSSELAHRLQHWRQGRAHSEVPVSLASEQPEVVPRFQRIGTENDNVIVFLDDTSLLSQQAERLTLNSLGRLSSSIAHEIRNPLAAISHSAQLLAESEDVVEADQRLLEIISNQCSRMNAIVENILHMARRGPSRPERIEVGTWLAAFVDEYRTTHPVDHDEVRAVLPAQPLYVVIDPGNLHQTVWNLVQNAVRYGRFPEKPARVTVQARTLSEPAGTVVIEVIDRGPGIPPKIAAHIFEPFYTTHEFGTGLGLYLARQMCEANQALLEHHSVPGGGSCFRIRFAPSTARGVAGSSEFAAA